MKKTIIILGTAIITLSSCGGDSGLKSLIEKGAKLDCRKSELRDKAFNGDAAAVKEMDDIEKQLDELQKEFADKYGSKMDDHDFEKKAKKYDDEARAKYCKPKK